MPCIYNVTLCVLNQNGGPFDLKAILNLLVDAEEYTCKQLETVKSGDVTVYINSLRIIFGQMDKEHESSFLHTCPPATSQLCVIAHFLFHLYCMDRQVGE